MLCCVCVRKQEKNKMAKKGKRGMTGLCWRSSAISLYPGKLHMTSDLKDHYKAQVNDMKEERLHHSVCVCVNSSFSISLIPPPYCSSSQPFLPLFLLLQLCPSILLTPPPSPSPGHIHSSGQWLRLLRIPSILCSSPANPGAMFEFESQRHSPGKQRLAVCLCASVSVCVCVLGVVGGR